jgi:hypothetical protein
MPIIWLVVGAVFVIAPFIILIDPSDPWASVVGALIGGAFFLIGYLFFHLRNSFFSKNSRLLLTIYFGIVIVASITASTFQSSMASYQRELQPKLRTSISDVDLFSISHDVLMPVLREYHKQTVDKKTCGELFLKENGNKLIGRRFVIPEENQTATYIVILKDSLIVMTSIDSVAHGVKSDFKNYNGLIGHVQTRTVLTLEGVDHAREN